MGRPRLVTILGGAFVLGVGLRALPLLVSSLPATLDGFRYGALAAETMASGQLPWYRLDADELVFTLVLGVASRVTGRSALRMAQPLAAVAGGFVAVFGVAIVGRLGREHDWPAGRVRLAAALAGFGLAAEGLLLRRTGVPDEEVLGLVLVALLAVAVHRSLASRRPAWLVVAVVLPGVLPPLHNLTAVIGALTVTALAGLHLDHRTDRVTALLAVALSLWSWVLVIGYVEIARWVGLTITFSELLRGHEGLFVAWAILLVVVSRWARATTTRARQVVYLVAVAILFAVVAVNAAAPVFPGTVPTPPIVLLLVFGLVVPVVYVSGALSVLPSGTGRPLLAMFAAPIAFVFYGLTAALTPAFFGAVMRAQTFAHPAVLILAGVAAAGLGRAGFARDGPVGWTRAGVGLVMVGAVLVTLPLGYVALDTAAFGATTPESAYGASQFAAERLPDGYTTDHGLTQVGTHAFGATGVSYGPVASWLAGGPPPACPVLARESWTTSGAYLYPTEPATISADRFRRWRRDNSQVYTVSGIDTFYLVVPPGQSRGRCVPP